MVHQEEQFLDETSVHAQWHTFVVLPLMYSLLGSAGGPGDAGNNYRPYQGR